MVDFPFDFFEWKGEGLVITGKITALQTLLVFKKVNKIMRGNYKKWWRAVRAALSEPIASRYRFLAVVVPLELRLIVNFC